MRPYLEAGPPHRRVLDQRGQSQMEGAIDPFSPQVPEVGRLPRSIQPWRLGPRAPKPPRTSTGGGPLGALAHATRSAVVVEPLSRTSTASCGSVVSAVVKRQIPDESKPLGSVYAIPGPMVMVPLALGVFVPVTASAMLS